MIPRPKSGRDGDGAGQGGHPKGNAELVVEGVGSHGAEHGDHHHRRPVGDGVVPSRPKLNPQGECETCCAKNDAVISGTFAATGSCRLRIWLSTVMRGIQSSNSYGLC